MKQTFLACLAVALLLSALCLNPPMAQSQCTKLEESYQSFDPDISQTCIEPTQVRESEVVTTTGETTIIHEPLVQERELVERVIIPLGTTTTVTNTVVGEQKVQVAEKAIARTQVAQVRQQRQTKRHFVAQRSRHRHLLAHVPYGTTRRHHPIARARSSSVRRIAHRQTRHLHTIAKAKSTASRSIAYREVSTPVVIQRTEIREEKSLVIERRYPEPLLY